MFVVVAAAVAADIIIAVHLMHLLNASSLQNAYKRLECECVCAYDNLQLFLNLKIRNVIRA